MRNVSFALLAVFAVLSVTCLEALHAFPEKRTHGNPVELGQVKWLRNFDEGKAHAKKEKKPILIMFQEVPG